MELLRKAGHRGGKDRRPPYGPGRKEAPGRRENRPFDRPPFGGPHGMPFVGPYGMPYGKPGMEGRPPFGREKGPKPAARVFPRERILLTVLESGEDGLRQKDIAEALGINASSLSEQIDRLETDRYLERVANPDDKRSTLIRLTEKGKARAWEVSSARQERAAAFCGNLTDEEKDTLIALLTKLLDEREKSDGE